MPVFSYECKKCGEKFDLLVGVNMEKPQLKCVKCGSKNIRKTFAVFSTGEPKSKGSSGGASCPTGTCPTCF